MRRAGRGFATLQKPLGWARRRVPKEKAMTHPALVPGATALITGGASGIGLAAARRYAGMGLRVELVDVGAERLEAAAAQVKGEVGVHDLDVRDRDGLAALARSVRPDVLMANAGLGPASDCFGSPEAWDTILGVNLIGVVNTVQAFGPQMAAGGRPGLILCTGSKQGITTPPGNPAYNVSKAGVKAFTEALAHQLRNTPGCRVSAHLLIPGWVHTGLTAASGAPKPAGAWTADQMVDFLLESLDRGDFYILCPDNDVPRALDEKRIAWAAGDLIENRPALSRWHPDWSDAFAAYLAGGPGAG
jgi:NAD(P)-dependent dehydrogenase (short-subunit alcohol dehydrogenase family)